MLKIILISIACIIGSIVLVGIPGSIILLISTPFLWLFHGFNAMDKVKGDAKWPMVILISVAFPLIFPLAHYVAFNLFSANSAGEQKWIFAGLLCAWGVLCTLVVYLFRNKL